MKEYNFCLYDVLEIDRTCSLEDVKKAYRRQALKYHPDRPTGDTERFQQIAMAYEILSDSVKRREYDELTDITRSSELANKSYTRHKSNQFKDKSSNINDFYDRYSQSFFNPFDIFQNIFGEFMGFMVSENFDGGGMLDDIDALEEFYLNNLGMMESQSIIFSKDIRLEPLFETAQRTVEFLHSQILPGLLRDFTIRPNQPLYTNAVHQEYPVDSISQDTKARGLARGSPQDQLNSPQGSSQDQLNSPQDQLNSLQSSSQDTQDYPQTSVNYPQNSLQDSLKDSMQDSLRGVSRNPPQNYMRNSPQHPAEDPQESLRQQDCKKLQPKSIDKTDEPIELVQTIKVNLLDVYENKTKRFNLTTIRRTERIDKVRKVKTTIEIPLIHKQIKVVGQGDWLSTWKRPGDVLINVIAEKGDFVRVNESDIFTYHKISLVEWYQGFTILDFLDGTRLQLSLDRKSLKMSNMLLKIPNKGLPKDTQIRMRGSLYVQLVLLPPDPGDLEVEDVSQLIRILGSPDKNDMNQSKDPIIVDNINTDSNNFIEVINFDD